jgi:hypothetical protein
VVLSPLIHAMRAPIRGDVTAATTNGAAHHPKPTATLGNS